MAASYPIGFSPLSEKEAGKQPDDYDSEPMDMDATVPNVGNSKYFTWQPVRRHEHPTNPLTNGFISSRILPDGSNTFRCSTALESEFEIPDVPDYNAWQRMQQASFREEYGVDPANPQSAPVVLTSGTINLGWKE